MHYMFGGKVTLPLTIMTAIGAGTNSAAQHSETVYSVFAHYPGLKCVVPSSPYTAKGLYASAIRDDDPVVIFNNMLLMGRGITEGILPGEGHVPEEPYTVPIGRADVAVEGTDVTLVGIGVTTRTCLDAARDLQAAGYSPEVVDLLSVSPMDEETLLESVRKTRKIVIVDEDYPRCSVAGDISALVAEQAFDYLDAPPVRVTAPHASVPYSRALEPLFMPSKESVVEAALSNNGVGGAHESRGAARARASAAHRRGRARRPPSTARSSSTWSAQASATPTTTCSPESSTCRCRSSWDTRARVS